MTSPRLVISALLFVAVAAPAMSACGPSGGEQDDAAYEAQYECVDDFAATYQGDKVDLMYMDDQQRARWADCAEARMKDTAPDFDCDAEGCWRDGEGWEWGTIAGDQRCDHPEYGDACSLPENQRDPDDPITLGSP